MQINKLKLASCLLIGLLGIMTTSAFSFDLTAKYNEVNFSLAVVPDCGDETQYIPALPEDSRAELYYQVARQILGENDTKHYKQMYVLGDKAAEMGHWRAKLFMANLYLQNSNGYYSQYNPKKAKAYIVELMKQNVPAAFYDMGKHKLNGMDEFRNDPIPASVYLFEAAKLNDAKALTDMYDIFMNAGRPKDARDLLNCAVKQKQDVAGAFYRMSSVLESESNTEASLVESFKYLYKAAKEGSYDAVASFASKDAYYKQQFGKDFFSKQFIERMQYLQNAKSSLYTHSDPYRKSLGKDYKVRGNVYLAFPNLERILPFPPAKLPKWDNRDISIALSPEYLKIYQTDFDYDKLVKEAQAIKVETSTQNTSEQKN